MTDCRIWFLTGNKLTSRIYLNEGDFSFKDITANFEGLTNEQWISGVSVVDINNDGNLDLYFTSTTSKNPDLRKNQLWDQFRRRRSCLH